MSTSAEENYAERKYEDVNEVPTAHWDTFERCWVDATTRKKVAPPSLEDLRGASMDETLGKLRKLVPEMEYVLEAYKEQTINAFVGGLLDRLQKVARKDFIATGRELMAVVIRDKEDETKRSTTYGWTLTQKVENFVDEALRNLVKEELTKLVELPGLLKKAIEDTLSSENLRTEANDLITPKLVDLIKELRLELTAGKRY